MTEADEVLIQDRSAERQRRVEMCIRDSFEKLPPVTIQLPLFNERYVVERLVEEIVKIEYPKELLQIQVLDDSTDDTARCV